MVKTDQIPVISQAKSLVQYVAGDKIGAMQTHRTFMNECPGVSQVKSYMQWKDGDQLGAMITQAKFFNATKESVVCIINGTPVVGHAKAMAHYAMGDYESGNAAMKAASRTVGVITGGTVGMTIGGPPLAIAGGIAGGVAIDALATKVESATAEEYRPNGVFFIKDRIEKGEASAAEIFDAATGLAMDGAAGYVSGKRSKLTQNAEAVQPPKSSKSKIRSLK
jgi:hypothetical protein